MLNILPTAFFVLLTLSASAAVLEHEVPQFKSVFRPEAPEVKAKLIEKTIEFVRRDSLPLPKGLVKVESSLPAAQLSLRYKNEIHGFHQGPNGKAVSFYYATPFGAEKARVFYQGKPLSSLSFTPIPGKAKTTIVDPSCFPYNVDVEGMEKQYISLGCKKQIVGNPGDENIVLQILWTAPGWKPLGSEEGVHTLNLYGKVRAEVAVENERGETRTFALKASAPKDRKRLGVALGFGPYHFLSQNGSVTYDEGSQFMYMLYAGLALTEKHSFKLFDAYIQKEATFNNFGFYFSSDIAKILDDRLVFNTLLGFQHLLFELPEGESQRKIIYPQGIEMILSHPFGLKNYKLMLGGFVGAGGGQEYNNVWIRFGKGMFYELNYLKWSEDETNAEAIGLSVGIPLFSAF